MAKKKKKQAIKLNNKIKKIFKGAVFEDGIKTLERKRLNQLFEHIFGLKAPASKSETIKAISRIWSEADINIRRKIVNFFEVDTSSLKETILTLLEDKKPSKWEVSLLVESLRDLSVSKLTKQKVENKLKYIRLKEKISEIEALLDIKINSSNKIEFVHSFEFRFQEEIFTKLLLVKGGSLDPNLFLKEKSEILDFLKKLKLELISKKKIEINEFLEILKDNRYLTKKEILNYLKQMPIDSQLKKIPIGFKKIQEILKEFVSKDLLLLDLGNSIEFEMIRSAKFYSRKFYYKLRLSYEKDLIYSTIWENRDFLILEDFEQLDLVRVTEFSLALEELLEKAKESAKDLKISSEEIENFILDEVEKVIKNSGRLRIKAKSARKILYAFKEYIKPIREKAKKEEFLAKSIKDFKLLFPLARKLKRKIIFNVGPTNSGKTYQAMQQLKDAQTGYYLAPLRLLALEGYEKLKEFGVNVSLITGEEEIIDEESTHVSSTIEMLNLDVEVDLCVIDEIQMIKDRDRGWAWVNALIGAPAKKVILTGSKEALEIVKEVCNYLEEELEIVEYERKNPLKVMQTPTPLDKIEPNSAIVTFSRRDVLALKHKLSKKYSISVIYGNLSPEVRREEAKRFREGKTQLLIATDAIAMGLNLPIKNIIFARDNKFDGFSKRELTPTEITQIAGRAGRFGLHEEGFVGALDKATLKNIQKKLSLPLEQIKPPLQVMATLEHILLISEILESDNLLEILEFFSKNMEFEGPFVASNIESMIELAQIVEDYNLDLKTKYIFSLAPVSLSSPYLEVVFQRYLDEFQKGKEVRFIAPKELPAFALTQEELLEKEDRVKEVSLYLWLSFKFPEKFPDTQEAIKAREKLNKFIENTLKRGEFKKLCRICKKELDFTYKFNICDRCFQKRRKRF